jgi:hypothetical protein
LLGGLTDIISGWADGIKEAVTQGVSLVVEQTITTPTPIDSGTGFLTSMNEPTGGLWTVIWPIYQDMQIVVTTLFMLAIVTTLFMGVWRERAERRKSIRRLIFWFPVAYWWWWIGGWFLRLNKELTNWLLEGGGDFVSSFEGLMGSAVAAGIFAVILYAVASIILVALAAVYLARYVAIYMYMLGMPLLLWLRCLPFKPVQSFGKKLSTKFYPLVMMTIPVAFLLRVGIEVMTYEGVEQASAVSAEAAARSADVAAADGGGIGIITGMLAPLFGIMIMMLAAVVPKFVFSGFNTISSAAKTGTRVGKNIAGGAANTAAAGGGSGTAAGGGSGTAAGGGTASGGQGSNGSTTQSTSNSPTDPHAKNQEDPFLDIGKGRKRKKQRERGQALGAAAVGGASSLAGAAKSMGSKAKQGAKGAAKEGAKARAQDGDSIRNAFQSVGQQAKQKASDSRVTGTSVGDVADRAKSFRENQIDKRLEDARGGVQESLEEGRKEAASEADSYDDLDQTTSSGVAAAEKAQERAQEEYGIGYSESDHAQMDTELDRDVQTEPMNEDDIGVDEDSKAAQQAEDVVQRGEQVDRSGGQAEQDTGTPQSVEGTDSRSAVGGNESDQAVSAAEDITQEETSDPLPRRHQSAGDDPITFGEEGQASDGDEGSQASGQATEYDPITFGEEGQASDGDEGMEQYNPITLGGEGQDGGGDGKNNEPSEDDAITMERDDDIEDVGEWEFDASLHNDNE